MEFGQTVAAADWDSLDEDTQKWIQTIVDGVRADLESKGPVKALETLEEQDLDGTHKFAAWSRFSKPEQALLRKAQDIRKATKSGETNAVGA